MPIELHQCQRCGKQYEDWQGYCKHCDYDWIPEGKDDE